MGAEAAKDLEQINMIKVRETPYQSHKYIQVQQKLFLATMENW